MISRVLWVLIANYWIWEGWESRQTCSQLVGTAGGLEPFKPAACVWSEGSLMGNCALKPVVSALTLGGPCQNHIAGSNSPGPTSLGPWETCWIQSAFSRTFCLLYPFISPPPLKIQFPLKSGCLRPKSGTSNSPRNKYDPYLLYSGIKNKAWTIAQQLCDFRQITKPPWASVPISVRGG